MKNYIQAGEVIEVTAPHALASGAGCLVGTLFGVAATDATSGAPVNVATRGVYDLPAATHASDQAIVQGGAVYWDNTNKVCTATASGNTLVGKATVAKASTAAVVRVRLNG